MKTSYYNQTDEEIACVICPLCGAQEVATIGKLGRLLWYRCQDCGIDFNQRIDKNTPEPYIE